MHSAKNKKTDKGYTLMLNVCCILYEDLNNNYAPWINELIVINNLTSY